MQETTRDRSLDAGSSAVFALVAAALATGCAGGMSALDDLDTTLRNFHHHLVARSTDNASAYVANEGLEAFEALHDPAMNVNRLEEFAVVTVRELPPSKDEPRHRAKVVVRGTLRKSDSITVQNVRFHEMWERVGKRWLLVETSVHRVDGDGGRD